MLKSHVLKNLASCGRLAAFAALATCFSTANAAVTVAADFNLAVIRFAPTEDPGYFLFPSVQASGFTNDANLDNYVRIESNNHRYGGDLYPARGVGSGTLGSMVSPDTAALVTSINSGTGWTLTVVDGVTNQTRTYSLTVSTPGINADYIRPTTLDVVPGSVISTTPSFTWTEPPNSSPDSDWTDAFGGLYASTYQNSVFSPAIGATDLAWTPDVELNPDTYTLGISKLNVTPPQTLLSVSAPVPQGGAPALASFTKTIRIQSDANASDLSVPCNSSGVSVDIRFFPGIIGFSPQEPPVYILGIGMNATGFVDDDNTDNYIKIESSNNHFSGDWYPARGTGSGTAGSIGLSGAVELADDINAEGDWTLTVIDGTTNQTRTFTLDVTTPGFGTDYLRPTTLDVNPGDTISSTQTFTWYQDPTSHPLAQDTSAFGGAIAQVNPSNSVFNPGFSPTDTSWTPATPLNPDSYTFLVAMVNDTPDQSLVQATTPVPTSVGTCDLAAFTQSVGTQVSAQSSDLVVGGCDSIDFNGDTLFPDTADIDDFLSVFSGGPCSTGTCGDIDFNNDTLFPDTLDIDSLLSVFSGGQCLT